MLPGPGLRLRFAITAQPVLLSCPLAFRHRSALNYGTRKPVSVVVPQSAAVIVKAPSGKVPAVAQLYTTVEPLATLKLPPTHESPRAGNLTGEAGSLTGIYDGSRSGHGYMGIASAGNSAQCRYVVILKS